MADRPENVGDDQMRRATGDLECCQLELKEQSSEDQSKRAHGCR